MPTTSPWGLCAKHGTDNSYQTNQRHVTQQAEFSYLGEGTFSTNLRIAAPGFLVFLVQCKPAFLRTLFSYVTCRTHSTPEVALFRLKCFLDDGEFLNPKSSGKKKIIGHFFLHGSLVRCVPRPWNFSSGVRRSFFLSSNQFLGDVVSSRITEPRKKSGVNLYRGPRVF